MQHVLECATMDGSTSRDMIPADRREVAPFELSRAVPAFRGSSLPASILGTGGPRAAIVAVAEAKRDLEEWLNVHPDDYVSLVQLGELNLRIGLASTAQALLFHATRLPQPSWDAYQFTSLLL